MGKTKTTRVRTILKDGDGNEVIVDRDGSDIKINLHLRAEGRKRLIGNVNTNVRTLYIRRSRHKHLHNKSQSYGFNYDILKHAKLFDKVYLSDEYGSYSVPVKVILEEGKYLFFKQVGFEKQIFLSLTRINDFKTTIPF